MDLSIADNLAAVNKRIEQAAARAGRNADDITLVGVSKYVSVENMQIARDAGLRHFGENRAQELRDKYDLLGESVHWHFIGGLQANKIKYVVGRAGLIHSVDSLPLAMAIDRRAEAIGQTANILIQVNIAGEPQKGGVAPDALEALLKGTENCRHISIWGLMMIPPKQDDPEKNRPYFREMYQCSMRTLSGYHHSKLLDLRYLSMGMSDDFEIAIEEGANMVRVGSAIFGPRR